MLGQERLLWALWLLLCKKGEMTVFACLHTAGKERGEGEMAGEQGSRGSAEASGWSQQEGEGSGPKWRCQVGTDTEGAQSLTESLAWVRHCCRRGGGQ